MIVAIGLVIISAECNNLAAQGVAHCDVESLLTVYIVGSSDQSSLSKATHGVCWHIAITEIAIEIPTPFHDKTPNPPNHTPAFLVAKYSSHCTH